MTSLALNSPYPERNDALRSNAAPPSLAQYTARPARSITLTLLATSALGVTVPGITGETLHAVPMALAPFYVLLHITTLTLVPLLILQQLAKLEITPTQTTQAMLHGMEEAAKLTLAVLPVVWFMGTGGGRWIRWFWAYYVGGGAVLLYGLWRAHAVMIALQPTRSETTARAVGLTWLTTAFLVALPASLDLLTLL